jgi:hypothetical protein
MMATRALDLLDRRALALLRLVDVYGRTVTAPVGIRGDGVTSVRKNDGTIAILTAGGLEAYSASFVAPSSPAVASRHVLLDLEPASAEISARRFDLTLPRNADPAKSDQPGSVFRSVDVEMLPGQGARLVGGACALRVTVSRKSDKKLVQNALVRASSEDTHFTARGVTGARGEATLIFPGLPIAFPGAGANLQPDLVVRVALTVDTGSVVFNAAGASPRQVRAAPPFVDPDELGSVDVNFASGTPVSIRAGRDVPIALEWTQP